MHVLSMILPLIGLLLIAILAYYYKVEDVADLRKQTDQIASSHLAGGMISYFKSRAAEVAKGYQTVISDALTDYTGLGRQTNVIADLAEHVRRLEEEMARRHSD